MIWEYKRGMRTDMYSRWITARDGWTAKYAFDSRADENDDI